MTLDEIRKSDKVMLTPADVAEVMGTDPQSIRVWARQTPWRLGFPVSVMGSRVKIPRTGFLNFIDGKE